MAGACPYGGDRIVAVVSKESRACVSIEPEMCRRGPERAIISNYILFWHHVAGSCSEPQAGLARG